MHSKSIIAAAVLAGASTATAYEHPTFHGHGGHHPCKTTSTVIVYATETATVYEGAEGWGSGSGSTAAGAASAGGYPTYRGGAPAGPATVTVTATVSIDAAGQGHTWGVGDGNGASTAGAGSNSVANGWGSGNGYGASTAGAASTGVANGWGSGNGNGASTAGAASTSVANGWGSGNGNGASGAGGSSTTAGSGNGGKGGYGTGSVTGSVTGSATGSATSAYGSGPTGTGSALCLTNATASYLTNGYGQLLSAYTNATANSLLAADFTDTSDSINWLAGIPLGGYTFSSKAAFIAGQGTQPPIGFTVNSIMFSCTEVAFRWTATVGLKKFPAKGINLFTASNLNNTDAGWQIESMYSEFDVGAWEVDIGRTCSPQGANIAGST